MPSKNIQLSTASSPTKTESLDVVVLGAGLSGICMGYHLLKNGYTNFKIYDRDSRVGGTWSQNTYPGCSCDIPSLMYSFSFAQNPNWTSFWPGQEELRNYIEGVVDKLNLRKHMILETSSTKAVWDDKLNIWDCDFVNAEGEFRVKAKCLINSLGGLSVPNKFELPGLDTFQGPIFHSARWDHSVSLKDKNVIVVGNGCSANQFVPVIAPETKHLTQFIRSPQWIMVAPKIKITRVVNWMMRWIPFFQKTFRFFVYLVLERSFMMFKPSGRGYRKREEKRVRREMERLVPEKYHDILIPTWALGCKRRVIDREGGIYLKCLRDSNVEVTKDPLVEATPTEVKTKSGKVLPADVIIVANGFKVNAASTGVYIKGRTETLDQHFDRLGFRSYKSTFIAGMPNFALINGPNSASGHMSVIYTTEATCGMIMKALTPVLKGKAPAFAVTDTAEDAYTEWIYKKHSLLTWENGGCQSWYLDPITGKNFTTYPDFQTMFYLRSLWFNWKDFQLKTFDNDWVVGDKIARWWGWLVPENKKIA